MTVVEEPIRVLVCGSRTFDDANEIAGRLRLLPRGSTVVHGGARGADRLAATVACKLGFRIEEYPADWDMHGRSAGAIRNIEMVETDPDLVIAFWDGVSTGTAHTIELARKAGIPVEIHPGA